MGIQQSADGPRARFGRGVVSRYFAGQRRANPGGPCRHRGSTGSNVDISAIREGQNALVQQPGITAPRPKQLTEQPLFGPLALPGDETGGRRVRGPSGDLLEPPAEVVAEGPPDGLTLDMAIERLLTHSLDLRSKFMEIPQAQADVLSAGLRANPIFYADGQLVPYGQYSRTRPGGQTQYDVNVSYPLDVTRKRVMRTQVASCAKRVLEAQYQDAVRMEIDKLYNAYVDVLAARQTAIYARERAYARRLGMQRLRRPRSSSSRRKRPATRPDLRPDRHARRRVPRLDFSMPRRACARGSGRSERC